MRENSVEYSTRTLIKWLINVYKRCDSAQEEKSTKLVINRNNNYSVNIYYQILTFRKFKIGNCYLTLFQILNINLC